MASLPQRFLLALLLSVDVASADISCDNPGTLTMRAGAAMTIKQDCTMPSGGCSAAGATWPLPTYTIPGIPIVGKDSDDWAAGFEKVTMHNTFRGFDNLLPEGGVTKTFERTVSCTPKDSTTPEVKVVNLTVHMMRSDSDQAAVVPPAEISVPCLVEGVETPVVVNFGTPNSSLTYRSLVADWKMNEDIPWVYSRPSSATSKTPTDTTKYEASTQPILSSIELSGSNGHSLVLNMKPPESSGGNLMSWQVCIIPGDGYNWFPEICTQEFAVRKSQEECDETTTTSSGSVSAFHGFTTWKFAMTILMSAFLHRVL